MQNTSLQYDEAVAECRKIFEAKLKDYGPSWRILRLPSITDQIFIKAKRIRTLQSSDIQRIDEGIKPEFIGIYNYSLIALIQSDLGPEPENLSPTNIDYLNLYDQWSQKAKRLMLDKNHDYDEAWRQMRLSSLTDIILMKIKRIKQIEDNSGLTAVSEGIESNYLDIMNYAIFSLIKLSENQY
jgi:hypothetical protein